MDDKKLVEIKEIIQSSNINFLIGSGASRPFLPTLLNIESDINKAIKNDDLTQQVEGYKRYFKDVMLPCKKIISEDFCDDDIFGECSEEETAQEKNYEETKKSYQKFFESLAHIVLNRKTTVLSKQINIFTTNIDLFMESTLEHLHIDYNDGFSGKLKPVFSLSNFKKSVFQRSLHFDHKSEIPTFNIFKIHGSLSWEYGDSTDNIFLNSQLSHFDSTLLEKTKNEFIEEYKNKILVVNPENQKFSETVLNTYYYELLRAYSSELERENSVLFVIGFSMEDQHIRKITQRVAQSNPTLKILIFLHSNNKKLMEQKMEIIKFKNIEILCPEGETENYDLNTITDKFFSKILSQKKSDDIGNLDI